VSWRLLTGDVRTVLATLEPESVQTCVTSPPYWGLRDYGNNGQIGLEPTPEEYVANLVAVFSEVRRVLRADATLWLNLGDSFGPGKQLVGIPWRVAFALQADGWVLRSDIIWAKPNPMPESVTDRPTKAHEYLFLLTKSPRYFYDADAIREEHQTPVGANGCFLDAWGREMDNRAGGRSQVERRLDDDGAGHPRGVGAIANPAGRNKRSVWTVSTQPFPGAHFATFPPKLIEPCILAGSAPDDLVLDPFAGAGTTLLVAEQQGRDSIGVELNPEYAQLARDRLANWDVNRNGYLTGDPEPLPGQGSLL
jgi:DNA modification methylase